MSSGQDDEDSEIIDTGASRDWGREPTPPGFERGPDGQLQRIPEDYPRDWNMFLAGVRIDLVQRRDLWPVIIATYAKTGRIEAAASVAGVSSTTVRKLMKSNREFALAMDEAKAIAASRLRAEVIRRGYEGVTKPIIQQGKIVTTVQEYDNSLLVLALKLLDEEVREVTAPKGGGTTVNVNATATAGAHASAIDGPEIDLRQLTAEQRSALRALRNAKRQPEQLARPIDVESPDAPE